MKTPQYQNEPAPRAASRPRRRDCREVRHSVPADYRSLVPKLCLGTRVTEAPLRAPLPAQGARVAMKQSFQPSVPKRELGNEMTIPTRSVGTRILPRTFRKTWRKCAPPCV